MLRYGKWPGWSRFNFATGKRYTTRSDDMTTMELKALLIQGDKEKGKRWTDDENKILRANYTDSSIDELLEMLPGRNERQIRRKASYWRLYRRLSDGSVGRGRFAPDVD